MYIYKIICIFLLFYLNLIKKVHTFSFGDIFDFMVDNTVCKFRECCNNEYIPANFYGLDDVLQEKIYGQHLAQKLIIDALKSHWKNPNPPKPLTISLHGWPGCGKNYITKFIKENLYKKGGTSNYVHQFNGRITFPLNSQVAKYQEDLYNWIRGNITKCPRQLFIFDEVDKMPPKLLNIIKPIIDYNDYVEKVDYKKSVFIFLSNTGAQMINKQMDKLWSEGKQRLQLRMSDFESLIAQGAFNEEGGFHHSDAIKSNLIDHYVPFLPMEMEHIRLCILDQFKIRGINIPPEEAIQEVLDHVEWGPPPTNRYSKTGCKRLSQKVGLVIEQYRLYTKHDEL